MPSFGLENLLADWTFLNFLQYFGDDAARQKTGYALSPDYFDVITRRDPRFVEVYPFLSNSISYQLGKPEQAIQFMRRGTAALSPAINPKAFQLWRFMSLDQLLLLGDIPGAIESLEKAADWVEGTEYAPYGATFRQTANFLRKEPNSKPVRVSAWGSIYEQAVAIGDKQTQQRARREIEALGGRIYEKDGRLYIEPPTTSPAKTNRP
jgi:tetratricopeptide (TPR) repeat protein